MTLANYRFEPSNPSRERPEQFDTHNAGTSWGTPNRLPYLGVVNVQGQEVEVLIDRIGDKPGYSDVVFCIDKQTGEMRSVKAEHVRVTAIPLPNGTYLPIDSISPIGQRFNSLGSGNIR